MDNVYLYNIDDLNAVVFENMSNREQYVPGAAHGAEVKKEGERWTLVLVRDLRHPPPKVWEALTDPEHLRECAPFDSDRNLGTVGTATRPPGSTVSGASSRAPESMSTRPESLMRDSAVVDACAENCVVITNRRSLGFPRCGRNFWSSVR